MCCISVFVERKKLKRLLAGSIKFLFDLNLDDKLRMLDFLRVFVCYCLLGWPFLRLIDWVNLFGFLEVFGLKKKANLSFLVRENCLA